MLTQLFVAFPDPVDGTWVTSRRLILRRYVRCARARTCCSARVLYIAPPPPVDRSSWCAIDIMSVLPFDTVGMIFKSQTISSLKTLRMIRLLRLLKLLRILRASRIMKRWEAHLSFTCARSGAGGRGFVCVCVCVEGG